MIILGLSGALNHDPSAALLVDGEVVAAAEEERFIRDKHAKNRMPLEAARYCLAEAGISGRDVDVVAFPYAPISLATPARWHFARRYWYAPDRSLDALFNGNRRYRRNRDRVLEAGEVLDIDWQRTEFVPVEHHLPHASSAYHLSGFSEKTAILGVDGKGEYATTFFGYGENGNIHKIKEFYDPDSLSGVYGAITEFLGFEMLDGEYKVMGMAPYGDASRYDLGRLIRRRGRGFEVDTTLVNTVGLRRHKENGVGYYFSDKLIDWLGPRRQGDVAEPVADAGGALAVREPADRAAHQHDDAQGQPPGRHGRPERRQQPHDVVADPAPLARRVDAERHPEQPDGVAERAELHRRAGPLGDHIEHGQRVGVRAAQVELDQAAEPLGVLDR